MRSTDPTVVETRCIRVHLDADTHRRLSHVAIDRHESLADLIREGARLVLAQHRASCRLPEGNETTG